MRFVSPIELRGDECKNARSVDYSAARSFELQRKEKNARVDNDSAKK